MTVKELKSTPQDSGISLQKVLELEPTIPLFGVCMGLQCIGEAFGVFSPFLAGRFHSLVIEKETFLDKELEENDDLNFLFQAIGHVWLFLEDLVLSWI
ncbi:hypothetical protein VNO77_01467 [Canavalia gladiata]|uniref:Glutamine amidotransferase domain-containing protein n=1 Tax=Canavalia gladiata TaxID=3824 RepID=A0AAN9MRY2_CANGL